MASPSYSLFIQKSSGEKQEIVLDPGRSYTIGRKEADIELSDEPACSRLHATLEFQEQGWKLSDDFSTNGTKVDGKRVNFAFLKPETVVHIGKTRLSLLQVSGNRPPERVPQKSETQGVPKREQDKPTSKIAEPDQKPGVQKRRKLPVRREESSSSALVAAGIAACVLIPLLIWILSGPSSSSDSSSEHNRASDSADSSERLEFSQKELFEKLQSLEYSQEPSETVLQSLATLEQNSFLALREHGLEKRFISLKQRTLSQLEQNVKTFYDKELSVLHSLSLDQDYQEAQTKLDELTQVFEGHNAFWQERAKHFEYPQRLEKLESHLQLQSEKLITITMAQAGLLEELGRYQSALEAYTSLLSQALLDDFQRADITFKQELLQQKILYEESQTVALEDETTPREEKSEKESEEEAKESAFSQPEEEQKESLGLLPKGAESEEALQSDLFERIIEAARASQYYPMLELEGESVEIISLEESGIQIVSSEFGLMRTLSWQDVSIQVVAQLFEYYKIEKEEALLLGLALLAFKQGEEYLAHEFLFDLYQLDHSLKPAIDHLIASKRGVELPPQGFVIFEKRFLLPEEKECFLQQQELKELVEVIIAGFSTQNDQELRQKAERALDTLAGFEQEHIHSALGILETQCFTFFKKAEKKVNTLGSYEELAKLKEELDKAREYAFELIFDEVRWPYPKKSDHDKIAQEVLERVKAVEVLWQEPLALKRFQDAAFHQELESLHVLVAKIQGLASRAGLEKSFLHESYQERLEELWANANRKLSLQTFALNKKERDLIEYSQEVMAENAAKREEFRGKPAAPDDEAWEQLAITNRYRMMMGVQALKMNFKLYWACKHHSRWCMEGNGGQLSHQSPGGPRGTTPGQRMTYEGYPAANGSGENIHSSSVEPTPLSSHLSWLASSGHHRNILNAKWKVLGTARFGFIWTQNFGATDEGSGNQDSRGGQ